MSACYIFGAMPISKAPSLHSGDLVIAADNGYRRLTDIGVSPDLVIGDFDSSPRPDCENVKVFPKKKDDTDMMLAVKEGLSRGFRHFYLYGGTGGRLDHTLANIQTLAFLRKQDAVGFLCGDNETITLLLSGDRLILPKSAGETVSLFSFSEAATVNVTGLLYAGEIRLTKDFPLGVSNETIGKVGEITVAEGELLVVLEGNAEKFAFPS